MNSDYYISLIYQDLKGILSDSDRQELNAWLGLSEKNRQLASEIRLTWDKSGNYHKSFDLNLDDEFAVLQNKMNDATPAKRIRIKPARLKVAAGIAILIIASFFISQKLLNSSSDPILYTGTDSNLPMILEDGTKVWLSTGSQLALSGDFGHKDRSLDLIGQAYFEVATDSMLPFIVSSGDSRTKVLGTSFNLKSASRNNGSALTVASGRVSFSTLSGNEEIILEANQIAEVDANSGKLIRGESDNLNELAWQREYLIYNQSPLETILTDLSDFFQIKIQLENIHLSSCEIGARFSTDRGPEPILQNLADLLGGEIKKLDKHYELKGGKCPL